MMLRIFTSAALIVCLVGCGGGNADGFTGERGQVTGKISCGGKSIPEGSKVVFQSKEGANYMATGTVNAAGEYSLLYNASPSVPCVTYLVTITPPVVAGGSAQMAPDQMASAGQLAAGSTAPPPPFPARYSSAVGSKLEFTVKGGANKADFELPPA